MPVERYTVKAGDCLWKIAREQLGSGSQWPRIWRYNNRREVVRITGRGIPDPDRIYPGQVLLIPRMPNTPLPASPSRTAAPPPAAAPAGSAPAPSPAARGRLSKELPKVQSPFAMKFSLEELKLPPMVQPGMIMDVKMSGDVVLLSRKQYPSLYVTDRRALEMQAAHQANAAFASLFSDTRLSYDVESRKLTYRSMLVAKSHQPSAWATAVGVEVNSGSPLPKLRFEFQAPSPLKGDLPDHFFTAINLDIIVELTPKPDGPVRETKRTESTPQSDGHWRRVVGTGLLVGAVVLAVGTVVEDFITVGGGIADDPVCFIAAWKLTTEGWALLRAGTAVLPAARIPAVATLSFALAIGDAPRGERLP